MFLNSPQENISPKGVKRILHINLHANLVSDAATEIVAGCMACHFACPIPKLGRSKMYSDFIAIRLDYYFSNKSPPCTPDSDGANPPPPTILAERAQSGPKENGLDAFRYISFKDELCK